MSGRSTDGGAPSGLLLVDKPAGLTSHDVVSRVRRLAGTRKVGHAGTLDPAATGLLILGVNAGTKLLQYVTGMDKTYDARIRLGVETSTDDAEGEILGSAGAGRVVLEQVDSAIGLMRGDIMQVPAAVSAIKVDGERAYALARRGQDFTLEARPVTVGRFVRTSGLLPSRSGDVETVDFDATVDCSSGTYIRSLARDIGRELGVGGHLVSLRRTRIGPWEVEASLSLERLTELQAAGLPLPITPVSTAALGLFPELTISTAAASRFRHGAAPEKDEVVAIRGTAANPKFRETYAVTEEADAGQTVLGLVERRPGGTLTWKTKAVYPADSID